MLAKSICCVPCAFSWRIFLLLIFCYSVLTAQAELQWESKTLQLDIHPLQVTGPVEFSFKNTGTNTVDILSVRTTCGCLKAKASANRVAVGESGAIHVTFDFRDKIGPQRKAVAIRTSDSKPVILYVQANVPEVYTLSSKRMDWTLSGDRNSKTCRLTSRLSEPVRLICATPSSDWFTVELISVREGFEYEVRVTPNFWTSPGMAVITVYTECPPELAESRTYTFSAVLR